jgi:hypothetical protein
MSNLSNEMKIQIEKHSTQEQGDIYKLYISKSKNNKHSLKIREEAKEIAEYALKLHNKTLNDIQIKKNELIIEEKKLKRKNKI